MRKRQRMRPGPLPRAVDPSILDALIPTDGTNARVALVTMPFSTPFMPSIQTGLLKALLTGRGIASSVYYLNLPFAKTLGYKAFHALCDVSRPVIGEWLFGCAAFGPRDDDNRFLERFSPDLTKLLRSTGWSEADLLHIRNRLAPEYVDLCATVLPWDRYAVVGFSSVFQQNTASLALARRVKERFPGTLVVFGGANFDDPMGHEYMHAFDFLDAACIGEADETFPLFLSRVLSDDVPDAGPGLAMRKGPEVLYGGPAEPVVDLCRSPTPDYDEFFLTIKALGMFGEWEQPGQILLTFEGSRGCWWGEKNHCTFCGVRSDTVTFRQKPASQIVGDIGRLSRKYPSRTFYAVDNIMGERLAEELCGELGEGRNDLAIVYQVKANLTREQMRALKNAGVAAVQPGIESLSSRLLKLMKKGVSGLANVEIMKWARLYSMDLIWNMLTAIPGERAEDYAAQVDWVGSLYHLQPPSKVSRVRLERGSPYYTAPGAYGIENVRPETSYSFVYPPGVDLDRAAYYFEADVRHILTRGAYKDLEDEIGKWQARWKKGGLLPELTWKKVSGCLRIEDKRLDGDVRSYVYDGPEAALYLFCENSKTEARCLDHLRREWDGTITDSKLQEMTTGMLHRRLMIREGARLLSLAIPKPAHTIQATFFKNTEKPTCADSR